MKNLPTNKSPRPDGIKGKFHKKFGKKLASIVLKLCQKSVEEGKPPHSIYKATIVLLSKPDRDTIKEKITGQYE